jgi:Flp pilus assembly protein TadG
MERDHMISKLLRRLMRRPAGARAQRSSPGRGQAAVEFALVLTVAMIVLFVAVQLAIIGEAALSLGQMNYQGARWAAVNSCNSDQDVATYMAVVGSTTITTPSSCGTALTIKITDTNSSGTTATSTVSPANCTTIPTATSGCSPTVRNFGTSVIVNITYTIPSSQMPLLLGKSCTSTSNFLGITFPCTLSSTETAMAE